MVKEEEEREWVSTVDEREEVMVTPGKNPTLRTARFLKPSVTHIDQVAEIPLFVHNKLAKWPFEVHFKGWRDPQKKWKQWVDQMSLTYEPIWKRAGIYDSIIASTYQIRKDKELVLGLTEFWCPHTNTFVFPWGEATMSLEDMFVLGGFSVLGEPVTSPLKGDWLRVEQILMEEYKKFWKRKAGKPCHSEWIKRFMDSNSELEHVALLSLWLSRCVLPNYPEETLRKQIFPIAIHLSQGTRIALAPAVLASIYRDLGVLKQHLVTSIATAGISSNDELHLSVWAPFQVMQIWGWERLPILRPNPNFLNHGEPRAARWHKIRFKSKVESVRFAMNSIENFELRPYSCIVDNWQRPSFYKEQGGWVFDSLSVNEELQSFSRCIMACELVGLDCIEQYLPHRVGMQFGMDQDLPGHFTRANSTWEVAWRTYDKPNRDVRFYLPSSLIEPNVTVRYFEWWKQCCLARQDAIQNILEQEQSSKSLEKSTDISDGNEVKCHVSPPPGFTRKCWWEIQSLSDDDNITLSQMFKQLQDNNTPDYRAAASSIRNSSSTQVQSPSFSMTEREIVVNSENSVHSQGESNVDEFLQPGMELEARISKLEKEIASLKESFSSTAAKKLSSKGPSHA